MLILALYAQTVDLRFVDFDAQNDLSSLYINDVEEDSLGFLWFASNNGLFRYDGYQMKSYLADEGMSYGINESNIYRIFTDAEGDLWITLNSYLCRYDLLTDSVNVVASETNLRGLNSPHVSNYYENKQGELFVSTENTIYRLSSDSLYFNEVFRITEGAISDFVIDGQGNLLIATLNGEGVIHFNNQTLEYKLLAIPENHSSSRQVTSLALLNQHLWIGTDGDGILSYNLADGAFKHYPSDDEYASRIKSLYVDRDGFLWLIDYTSLKLYVRDRDFFQGYYPNNEYDYALKENVGSFFQDSQGNYWSLHHPGGVGFSPKPKGFDRFDSHVNSPFRLTHDYVSAITEDELGNLYMGNPQNGMDIFHWIKGTTLRYSNEPENQQSLGKGAVQDVYTDSEHRIWVGTYWGGLQQFIPETGKFETYIHNESDPSSLAGNDVRSMVEDREGALWIAIHGKGLDRFDVEQKTFTHYNTVEHGLSNDFTFDVACDSTGNIWVGTAWGLSVLRPGKQYFDSFLYIDGDTSSLSANLIHDVFVDRLNRVWIATPKGIDLYLPESNSFKRYSTGFTNRNIVSISDDDENNIWVGTYHGISRLRPQTGEVLNLTKDDGLISNEFVPRSVFNNGKNTLFFGSVDGLTYFDPQKINYNDQPPKVYFTSLKIFNKTFSVHNKSVLKKNLIVADEIVLSRKDKVLTIEVSAINFVGAQNNRYAWYLEGFENDWNQAGTKREINYTNLNPGRYTLHVKASNNEGVWNNEGKSIAIIVEPPFWDTLLFKLTAGLFLLLLVLFYIRLRENKLLKEKVLLENKVEERAREIIEQKNKLEIQKQELQKANDLKNSFFNILAHDLRSPVSSIVQLTQLIKENGLNYNDKEFKKINDILSQTAIDTQELLEDLLLWGKSQTNNIQIQLEELNLAHTVSQVVQNFQQVASRKGVTIVPDIPEDLTVNADNNSIRVVLRNLLSNAVKFSYPDQQVFIRCELRGTNIVVVVRDEGVGMAPAQVKNIFTSKIKHSGIGTSGEKGSGLGLSLCYELVKRINGDIWAESSPKKGSTFYVMIPGGSDVSQ
ncbi:two-component regulator propeller domain-containing protein [Roseimarinus sediminis]|uniref:two-component regulator propeller domain-containing protein n=1 Tax=Roseimarinus sediminis TaxID=1610899 RepID=UPI003D21C4CD